MKIYKDGEKMHKKELGQKDLNFIVSIIAPHSNDKENLKLAIQEDDSFRKSVTADDKLFNFLMNRKELIQEASPALFFEILLRRALREMGSKTYTVERTISQRIPVFDSPDALALLKNESVFYYLADLLASFVNADNSSLDIDLLIRQEEKAEDSNRFFIHKRIGDACLLILGIFPEYLMYDYYYLISKLKPPLTGVERRSVADYEFLGQEFYRIASKETRGRFLNQKDVLQILSDNFYLAKKPLNFISEKYLAVAKR